MPARNPLLPKWVSHSLTTMEKQFINQLADRGKLQCLINLRTAYSRRVDWSGLDRDRIIRHLTRTLQSMGVKFADKKDEKEKEK